MPVHKAAGGGYQWGNQKVYSTKAGAERQAAAIYASGYKGKDAKLATDPPVSEAQRRAMFAAAEGKSKLGIPKKVGKEFVGDWKSLVDEINKMTMTEDSALKEAEDCLESMLASGATDEEIEEQRKVVRGLKNPTRDMAIDEASVRRYDDDQRLHVAKTHISKANVCEYFGKEIPGYKELDLDPDRKYKLYRDPEELKKAAKTFNNLPLLTKHVPVSASSHKPELVVGSTGTDGVFENGYLDNSLVIWAKHAIDAINRGDKKELSSAYYYRADMTPGMVNHQSFDGVMRDIIGNHVALVTDGRVGSDVAVGDEHPDVGWNQLARALERMHA